MRSPSDGHNSVALTPLARKSERNWSFINQPCRHGDSGRRWFCLCSLPRRKTLKDIDDLAVRNLTKICVVSARQSASSWASVAERPVCAPACAARECNLMSFADGSKLIESIPCEKCGENTYAVWRAPHRKMADLKVDIFQCPRCGHQMERDSAK